MRASIKIRTERPDNRSNFLDKPELSLAGALVDLVQDDGRIRQSLAIEYDGVEFEVVLSTKLQNTTAVPAAALAIPSSSSLSEMPPAQVIG